MARRLLSTDKAGPAVLGSQIVPFSNPKCSICNGRGWVTVVDGDARADRACVCAYKRFLNAHPGIFFDKKKDLFWPAGPNGEADPEAARRKVKAQADDDDSSDDNDDGNQVSQYAKADRLEKLIAQRDKLAAEVQDIERRIAERQVPKREAIQALDGEKAAIQEKQSLAQLLTTQAQEAGERIVLFEQQIESLKHQIQDLKQARFKMLADQEATSKALVVEEAALAKKVDEAQQALDEQRRPYRRELASLNSKLAQATKRMARLRSELGLSADAMESDVADAQPAA